MRTIALVLVVILALSLSVSAAMTAPSITKSLTFNGTTANCSVSVRDSGKTINVTMELLRGDVSLGIWSDSGTSLVTLDESLTVATGMIYTLKVYGTINGVPFEAAPIIRSN
jgi:hypothetical protein